MTHKQLMAEIRLRLDDKALPPIPVPPARLPRTTRKPFWECVTILPNGCLEWNLPRMRYGIRSPLYVAYHQLIGKPLSQGVKARTCETQKCVNLAHYKFLMTDEKAEAIRSDTRPQNEIAKAYGVSRSYVCMIKLHKRRKTAPAIQGGGSAVE